jgi:hypothetical protein
LRHPAALRAGDTLWLRGGTYRAPATSGDGRTFYCTIIGGAAAPILVKGYPGESAVVDGGIRCEAGGSYVQFWNFRITNTDTNRVIPSPAAIRATGLLIESKAVKVINMVIDNVSTPILWTDSGWANGDGGEIYGCLLWGSGIYDAYTPGYSVTSPWTRGNGIYAQNAKGQRFIRDCIVFRNFTGGILAYGREVMPMASPWRAMCHSTRPAARRLNARRRITPFNRSYLVNNYAFSEKPGNLIWVGYNKAEHNQNAVITGNYAAGYGSWTTGLIAVKNFDSATIRSNLFLWLARERIHRVH